MAVSNEKPYTPMDYSKIKVGIKSLQDAVLDIGNYKKVNPRLGDKEYVLIDTAGIRRKRGIELDSVEQYSVLRSIEAIKRADIVILVIDSSE